MKNIWLVINGTITIKDYRCSKDYNMTKEFIHDSESELLLKSWNDDEDIPLSECCIIDPEAMARLRMWHQSFISQQMYTDARCPLNPSRTSLEEDSERSSMDDSSDQDSYNDTTSLLQPATPSNASIQTEKSFHFRRYIQFLQKMKRSLP
ncbi:uncharacterized protein BYT42DRAFT_603305 [Radiomyces spectabilis]|uniref:uncharacterized protein n=1 Tax=Radiomyces spectabilis TaxID=64574 RepID=UPI0022202C55|nr:uncharacterized protein BYT42DRAFT_603305 [Radiomyces spectabilis]KAI8388897.1 hypothetical protein BYT42DRAFT_603305 [Radiomyces spectabilis]